jgi:hypothetical protein
MIQGWARKTSVPHLTWSETIFMTDEAWFHLSGYVNSENSRYWATENPHELHEQPLHDRKIGVWCGVSVTCIIGPIFFDSTVNMDVFLAIL